MLKIVSLLAFFTMLFFKNSQATAHQTPEYVRFSHEARKNFIKEMEQKHGWKCSSTGTSVPYDVEELTASFHVFKKGSIEEARKLLIPAVERFREVLHAHEQLRPYLRYYPLDIHDAKVFLYFKNENGITRTDGSIAFVCNDFKGDVIYESATKGKERGLDDYHEVLCESYDEALKKLGIEQPPHISLVDKTREAKHKRSNEVSKEIRTNSKLTAKQEELILAQYGSGDELKILALSSSNFCNSVAEAIRERIKGVAEKYFDEEFFKKIAAKELESSTGEYTEYWPNGELKVKVQWKNGKPDGHMHGWYPDCTEAFKGYFKEGLKQGCHMTFFPYETSGRLAATYYYNAAGQLHGEQATRYLGGWGLKASVPYQNGLLHGKVSLWRAEGGSLREWEYDQGKLVTPKGN